MDKKKNMIEKSILMVPLFTAFLWMGFLVLDVSQPDSTMKLAPSRLDGLINALFAFIVVYSVVLVILFLSMNKKIKDEPKKEIKGPPKARSKAKLKTASRPKAKKKAKKK